MSWQDRISGVRMAPRSQTSRSQTSRSHVPLMVGRIMLRRALGPFIIESTAVYRKGPP